MANFIFLDGWKSTLKGFEKEFGKEYAEEALWNIMLAATGEEIETTKPSIVEFIQGVVLPVVEHSRNKYNERVEFGKTGGRPSVEIDLDRAQKLHDEGWTWKAIAKELGCSVEKLRLARKAQPQKTVFDF